MGASRKTRTSKTFTKRISRGEYMSHKLNSFQSGVSEAVDGVQHDTVLMDFS